MWGWIKDMATTLSTSSAASAVVVSSAEPVVTRWRGSQHPNLALITQRMAAEGLQPYRWANGPHFRHAPRSYRFNKVLYCVQGLLTVIFPDIGQEIILYPGDRLDIPRGNRYAQIVGAAGAECVESERKP